MSRLCKMKLYVLLICRSYYPTIVIKLFIIFMNAQNLLVHIFYPHQFVEDALNPSDTPIWPMVSQHTQILSLES